jgi:glutathione synthase/RimK-type ligase-like ATP-grasp enzyme
LGCSLWVNHHKRASDAIYKPLQLTTAAKCGLAVPHTLVTNDAAAVRRFHAESRSGLICKVLGSNTIAEEGTLKVAYTHRLTDGDLANLDNVRSTAHQFQDWVPDKKRDARVIVVGDRIFPFFIHADSPASRVDWRADYAALRYELTDLPVTVENGVRGYIAAFGLVYAAFDFAIDATDQWFFLEANTAGQYGFLESNTDAPISASLADLLAGGLHGRLDRSRGAAGRRAH